MTPAKSQDLHNHRRWNPLYHFIALPIFLLNFGVATWQAVGDHGVWNLWQFVVSLGFVAGLLAARGMASSSRTGSFASKCGCACAKSCPRRSRHARDN